MEFSFVANVSTFEGHEIMWNYHIPIDPKIAEAFKNNGITRFVCTINNKETVYSAILSKQGYYYVLLNKAIVKKLKVIKGEAVEVHLKKDNSKYGMPMCEEMEEVLIQDPTALAFFDTLTPGKQRNLIHLVGKVKNTNSRINKALAIADHLVESKGELDFKRLNQLIKAYNQRT